MVGGILYTTQSTLQLYSVNYNYNLKYTCPIQYLTSSWIFSFRQRSKFTPYTPALNVMSEVLYTYPFLVCVCGCVGCECGCVLIF